MNVYVLHGLVIQSDCALHAPHCADQGRSVQITIRHNPALAVPDHEVPDHEVPDNEVPDHKAPDHKAPESANAPTDLFHEFYEGRAWHQVLRVDGATIVWYHDVAIFRIGAEHTTVEYRWLSHEPEHLGPILLEGYVFALLLTLRGMCTLHASAVALDDGRALALVGPSGAGKTTLAALLVAGGHPHLADDILGVDLSTPGVATVASGSRAIRLREKAWALEAFFPDTESAVSVDNRLVLSDQRASPGARQLAALWLPVPDRTISQVSLKRISTVRAFQEVLQNLRISLNDPHHKRRDFESVVELSRLVPTFVARVPWGPPWSPETIEALADAARQSSGIHLAT
jgi:hypothetical protein